MRRALRFSCLIIALALTACLGGVSEPVTVVGIYRLQTVNGAALPFTYPNGKAISSETLTLKPDGSFTDEAFRTDGTIISDVGTYTNFGGTLIMLDITLNLVYQARVEGTTLTTTVGSYTQVFKRD